MIVTRTLFAAFTAVSLLAVVQPSLAQTDKATERLSMLEAEIDALERELAVAQDSPATPGSKRQLDSERARLAAAIQAVEAEIAASVKQEAAALGKAASLFDERASDWPVPAPSVAPSPSPAPAPVPVPSTNVISSVTEGPGVTEITSVTSGATEAPTLSEGAVAPVEAAISDKLRRRVLTRPGALLQAEPGRGAGKPLRIFDVLYVFDETRIGDALWLQVGRSEENGAEGWLQKGAVEDWKTMLVMSFAPRSGRERVLFFTQPDPLRNVVESYDSETEASQIYGDVSENRHDRDMLIAMEPAGAVSQDGSPYLMPIIDWQETEFDSGYLATLLQLAAVNTAAHAGQPAPNASSGGNVLPGSGSALAGDMDDFRIGVAFVIDTTRSMGPYIEETKRFVATTYDRLVRAGAENQFSFALVGFRDNVVGDAGIGYVTSVFRDFDDPVDEGSLRDTVFSMGVSKSSTQNWREDAFAGLVDAIDRLSWEKVDARFIVLVTDASARTTGDPLARDPSIGSVSIVGMAKQKNISLLTIHLQTDQASRVSLSEEGIDDHRRGEEVYAPLQQAGGGVWSSFFRIRNNPVAGFESVSSRIVDGIVGTLSGFRDNQTLQRPRRPRYISTAEEAAKRSLGIVTTGDLGIEIDSDSAGLVSEAMINEVFRYQQEYLGRRAGASAPAFYRAWAVDRDLLDPRFPSLGVSVLTTRAQFNDLARRLEIIIERVEGKETGVGEFFEQVQERSGKASIDPQMKDFLPEFLQELPYQSDFLKLDKDSWISLGASGQEEHLSVVKQKLAAYRRLAADESGWLDLGSGNAAEQVYPLPLSQLP